VCHIVGKPKPTITSSTNIVFSWESCQHHPSTLLYQLQKPRKRPWTSNWINYEDTRWYWVRLLH